MYYYRKPDGTFQLLDGDKIAILAAQYIIELVRQAGIQDLNVGLIQTAYANGASTDYARDVVVRFSSSYEARLSGRKSQLNSRRLESSIFIMKLRISTLVSILRRMGMERSSLATRPFSHSSLARRGILNRLTNSLIP